MTITTPMLEAVGEIVGNEFALDSESWEKWKSENPDKAGKSRETVGAQVRAVLSPSAAGARAKAYSADVMDVRKSLEKQIAALGTSSLDQRLKAALAAKLKKVDEHGVAGAAAAVKSPRASAAKALLGKLKSALITSSDQPPEPGDPLSTDDESVEDATAPNAEEPGERQGPGAGPTPIGKPFKKR